MTSYRPLLNGKYFAVLSGNFVTIIRACVWVTLIGRVNDGVYFMQQRAAEIAVPRVV